MFDTNGNEIPDNIGNAVRIKLDQLLRYTDIIGYVEVTSFEKDGDGNWLVTYSYRTGRLAKSAPDIVKTIRFTEDGRYIKQKP